MNNRSPSSSRVESSAERSTSRMKKRPFRKVVKDLLRPPPRFVGNSFYAIEPRRTNSVRGLSELPEVPH